MLTQSVGVTSYGQELTRTVPRSVVIAKPRAAKKEISVREVAMALLIICLPLITMYFCNGINAQQEYALQELRAQVMTLHQENEADRLEVSKLEAPQRIQKIAEKDLGMKVPGSAVFGSDTLESSH